MKDSRAKLFPVILMLVAGSITSFMTYYFEYEIKTALLVLLSVLLIFYIIGLVVINVIAAFDKKNAEEIAAREAEEREKEQAESSQEENTGSVEE